jgi:multicomponent Na+:H+ antiporter subunit F
VTVVYELTLALLVLAAALAVARLCAGPTELDQVVALDVLVVLIVAGVGVEVAWRREVWNLALLGSVALLGFLGSVAAARLLELRSWEQPDAADPAQTPGAAPPGAQGGAR